MAKLSVNVNKLATLRNARGGNSPDVLENVKKIISYGAEGITVHPRPDGRHIRKEDVYAIAEVIQVEFNIEGYPDAEFIKLVKAVRPAQCTMVPDPPHVLTSNAGWNISQNVELLKHVIADLHQSGIRTSLFVDPDKLTSKDYDLLKVTATDRVELYTEAYATDYGTPNGEATLQKYVNSAKKIDDLGIEINAGHDLNLINLKPLLKAIPSIKEVSIGHALICDALEYGLEETVKRYLSCLDDR